MTMRLFNAFLALSVFVFSFNSASSFAQSGKSVQRTQEFSGYIDIVNQTGYDLYYLNVSHEDSTEWEEDMLGDEILESGETYRVTVTDYSSSIFDVRAEDEDGDTYTIYGLDIATEDLYLTLDHLDDSSSEGTGFDGYIDVTNNTGYDIYYLYVSHEDSTDWEEDMLGDDILEDGETFQVTVTDYASSIFDVRAEDEDGDTYTIYGIDIATEDLNLTLEHLDDVSGDYNGYIEVTNQTGRDIYYLYVSHEDTGDWEENVLGDDILGSDEYFRVELNNYASSIFDIHAEDEDGTTYTVYGIDVESENLRLTKKHRD